MKNELFSYLDFRLFLKEAYQKRKAASPSFSHRKVAELTQTSVGYFIKIIQGKVNISDSIRDRVSALFLQTPNEINYFNLLVAHNQSKNEEERNLFLSQILEFQNSYGKEVADRESSFYDDYNKTIVLEAIALINEKTPLEAILNRFSFPISKEKLDTVLSSLKEIGFIEEVEGVYSQKSRKLAPGNVKPQLLKELNESWMKLAIESMYKFEKNERHISSVTLSLSARGREQVEKLLYSTRKQMVAIAQNDREVEQVIQVNMQSFPLVRGTSD
ncbi:TIGR02147 family protein [bacterium]|nr:TIGR02147 family protein [bacterium]